MFFSEILLIVSTNNTLAFTVSNVGVTLYVPQNKKKYFNVQWTYEFE